MKTTEQKHAMPPGLHLQCPSCDQEVDLSARDQVDGTSVYCLHCGFESVLTREIEEHAYKSYWVLQDPEANDLDGERR